MELCGGSVPWLNPPAPHWWFCSEVRTTRVNPALRGLGFIRLARLCMEPVWWLHCSPLLLGTSCRNAELHPFYSWQGYQLGLCTGQNWLCYFQIQSDPGSRRRERDFWSLTCTIVHVFFVQWTTAVLSPAVLCDNHCHLKFLLALRKVKVFLASIRNTEINDKWNQQVK